MEPACPVSKSRHAGAYLDTLCPLTSTSPMQNLLAEGNSGCVPRAPTPIFKRPRAVAATGSDIDHAMSCNRLSGSRCRCHNCWKEVLSRVTAKSLLSCRLQHPH